jgi:hypothetical protein
MVTLTGSAFAPTGNLVLSGSNVLSGPLPSEDGRTLRFAIPAFQRPSCQVLPTPGVACPQFAVAIEPGVSLGVAVRTTQGASNSVPFVVTAPE